MEEDLNYENYFNVEFLTIISILGAILIIVYLIFMIKKSSGEQRNSLLFVILLGFIFGIFIVISSRNID